MAESGSLWQGIEAGEWVAATRDDAGDEVVVGFARSSGDGLTGREVVATRGVLEGAALKEIGHTLGVGTSSSSRYIAQALCRLAVTTRSELVALARAAREVVVDGDATTIAVRITPPTVRPEAPLTPAERDVIDAVLAGRAVADIAQRRGVSPRTVIQQTGSAYQKLGVRSRAELVVACAAPSAAARAS